MNNLAYIYLRQRHYSQAIEILETADTQIPANKETPMLRVACLYKGEIIDTPNERTPKRSISILLALHANLAAAYYLNNQYQKALKQAKIAIETFPKDNIGHRVLGCLYLAEGNIEETRAEWTIALKQAYHYHLD